MDEVAQFLNESQGDVYPYMKFQNINDFIKGKVIEVRLDQRESNFHPGEIEKTLLISVEVIQGRGVVGVKADEGRAHERPISEVERVTIWVKKGFMAAAISQAVRDAVEKTIAVGGTITLAFIEGKDTGKPQPAKKYRASYKPPVQEVAINIESGADGDGIPF